MFKTFVVIFLGGQRSCISILLFMYVLLSSLPLSGHAREDQVPHPMFSPMMMSRKLKGERQFKNQIKGKLN